MDIFVNAGGTLQKIAKVMFGVCIVVGFIGVIYFGINYIQMTGDGHYYSFFEGLSVTEMEVLMSNRSSVSELYAAKEGLRYSIICIGVAFAMIPLYCFGELTENVRSIEYQLRKEGKERQDEEKPEGSGKQHCVMDNEEKKATKDILKELSEQLPEI